MFPEDTIVEKMKEQIVRPAELHFSITDTK